MNLPMLQAFKSLNIEISVKFTILAVIFDTQESLPAKSLKAAPKMEIVVSGDSSKSLTNSSSRILDRN